MLEARLEQYMYAKTVNHLREYFADLDSNLLKYLYLPTSVDVPEFKRLGFVGFQILLVQWIGVFFVAYGVEEIFLPILSLTLQFDVTVLLRIIAFIVISFLYFLLCKLSSNFLKRHRTKIHNRASSRLGEN